MAKNYDYELYGHPSLLTGEERKFNVYFSVPEIGTDRKTGILLLIAGFGGNANSNVYKKMREAFADEYNLIVLQCDYMGYEFMGPSEKIDINYNLMTTEIYNEVSRLNNISFNDILSIYNKYKVNLRVRENLKETQSNYNEMGIIQAIDNITAVTSLISILDENQYEFNKNDIQIQGDSHGGYLAHLCNILSPNLFNLIIDNSAWLYPQYLKTNRYLNQQVNDILLQTEFEYIASNMEQDEEILNLLEAYTKMNNQCNIYCYHGTNDNLISYEDKAKLGDFISKDKFHIELIDEGYLQNDSTVFKNTSHGLGANFLEVYKYTRDKFDFKFEEKMVEELVRYSTSKYEYFIDYSNINPIVIRKNKY